MTTLKEIAWRAGLNSAEIERALKSLNVNRVFLD